MSKAKTIEERHFYITLCIKESYSSRELERQMDSGYYERYMLSKEKLTFIDEEYKVQVGGNDYAIDLLFFHRGLQCLMAFELKIGDFKPEYISKMDLLIALPPIQE